MGKRFNTIKAHFDREAKLFDKNLVRFAPVYDESIEALVSVLPFSKGAKIRVIDLGCGTGNIARAVLEKYPRASVLCFDLSEKMIELARAKLKNYKNVEYRIGDIRDFRFPAKLDAVISSLVLHHVQGEGKLRLFRRIYNSLAKGGVFYNADIIQGSSRKLQDVYREKWINFMRKQCTPAEIRRTLKNHRREDRPAVLMKELAELSRAGFRELDVVYKWYGFSVYGGVK